MQPIARRQGVDHQAVVGLPGDAAHSGDLGDQGR